MKIKGKFKKDFENYLLKNDLMSPWEYQVFEKLSEIVKLAYIIGFLDSKGLYINTFSVCLIYTSFGYNIRFKDIEKPEIESDENEFDTRSLATKDAISKAQEIYNSNKIAI